jgi:hypothetical protein
MHTRRLTILLAGLAALVLAVVLAPSTARTAPDMPFGTNGMTYDTGTSQLAKAQSGFDRLTGAGMDLLRQPFSWAELEPTQGHFDWRELDTIFQALPPGVNVMALMVDSPLWARDPEQNKAACGDGTAARCRMPPSPDHLDDWQRFVRAALERYGSRISAVELWNEPNLVNFWRPQVDPEAWAHVAQAAATVAREVVPDARIVSGGMVGGYDNNPSSSINPYTFIQRAYAAVPELKDLIDDFGMHPYSRDRCGTAGDESWRVQRSVADPCSTVPVDMQTARWDIAAFDPDAKIAVTEFGYHTDGGYAVTEEQQRDWLLAGYDYFTAQADVNMLVFHTLFDSPQALSADEQSFGMVHSDNTPKPAWTAFHDRLAPGT